MVRVGDCNQCGRCCVIEKGGRTFVCEHLVVIGEIGTAGASRCAVHDVRTEGMAIRMAAQDGKRLSERCFGSYPNHPSELVEGCSYSFVKEIGE